MKRMLGIVLLIYCLNGCSELRCIGAAAMREFHAEGVSVRENKAVNGQAVNADTKTESKTLRAEKMKSFSTFPRVHQDGKNPEKGLWEKMEPSNGEE